MRWLATSTLASSTSCNLSCLFIAHPRLLLGPNSNHCNHPPPCSLAHVHDGISTTRLLRSYTGSPGRPSFCAQVAVVIDDHPKASLCSRSPQPQHQVPPTDYALDKVHSPGRLDSWARGSSHSRSPPRGWARWSGLPQTPAPAPGQGDVRRSASRSAQKYSMVAGGKVKMCKVLSSAAPSPPW